MSPKLSLQAASGTQGPVRPASTRITALDFTKGAMVLYHWLAYFIGTQIDWSRYLRFLTPSFICITGFLISSVYLAKYGVHAPKLPRRLAVRGLKILAIFLALNVVIGLFIRSSYNGKIVFGAVSLTDMLGLFITGDNFVAGAGKVAAFYVLIPIGQLLLFSAAVVILCRYFRYTFQVLCAIGLMAVLILGGLDIHSGNLELISVGLLGVVLGYIPVETINKCRRYAVWLIGAYALYVLAIREWNVLFPLQVVGVCLTLALLYICGSVAPDGAVTRSVVLLGQYSLLGYIAQIVILQILHRAVRLVDLGAGRLPVSFIAAIALTVISIQVTDWARSKSGVLDRFYRTIFT
jgi:peptidoglycan/LPS O-acetylase OafA/YrhL